MKDLLKKLNLSDKEITVLLALYELGHATPSELATYTELVRPTVYVITESLVQRGFIIEDIAAKKQTFVAIPPDALLGFIPKMEEELEEKKEAIHTLVDTLTNKLKDKQIYIPKVQYVHQDQMLTFLESRIAIWNKSIEETDTDYIGYQDHTFVEINVHADWIERYWKHPSSKNIHLRLLSNESTYEQEVMNKKNYERRKILFWDGTGGFTYSTWICGDYTILVNTRNRPFSIIEINDPAFAQSQRQIFEAMWKEATK